MTSPAPASTGSERPNGGRDLLVPVLDLSRGAPDSVALATWHMALSNLVGNEVPHQLMGLWVFPERGGVVLLGPDALADDAVAVPIPAPHLSQDDLFELEQTLRKAQYASAIALPIRTPGRDVGVLVLGTFESGAYGPVGARTAGRLAERLVDPLTTLGGLLTGGSTLRPSDPLDPESFGTAVVQLANEAPTGPELVRRLSGALHPRIPHDRLEVLIFANGNRTALPLSGLSGRRRWGSGASTWSDLARLILEIVGDNPTGTIGMLAAEAPGLGWPGGTAPGAGPTRIASVIAARLVLAGETIGLVVLGHAAQGLYRPVDEETLAEAAAAIAARAIGFRLESEAQGLRGQLEVLQAPSLPVLRAAESLAGTSHLGEALTRFAAEVKEVVPHDRLRLILRLSESATVEFGPDGVRPLGDLPPVPVEESVARPVLIDSRHWSLNHRDEHEYLVVALRVADRTIGALVLEAGHFEAPRDQAAAAQQFGAVLAPHLELLRRSAPAARATESVARHR
ncbi:MAG: hypothetical protein ACKVZ0_20195 [Gemmatimonadales bacterium]